jgi:hypothetical protein
MRGIRRMQDAETLKIYDGLVSGVYDNAPCQGCGKNNTLDIEYTGCLVRSWEFMCFSMWRQYHDCPWDLPSDDEDGGDEGGGDEGGDDEDADSEDGKSDMNGGDEEGVNSGL